MKHIWDLEDPRLLVCEAKDLLRNKKSRSTYLTGVHKEERVSFVFYLDEI